MRRFLILLALLFLPAAMGYTQTVKQRVGKLEKRVTKNEKRIKALEKNTGKALAASKQASKKNSENLKNPIVTYFISADNRTSGSKMGMVDICLFRRFHFLGQQWKSFFQTVICTE